MITAFELHVFGDILLDFGGSALFSSVSKCSCVVYDASAQQAGGLKIKKR